MAEQLRSGTLAICLLDMVYRIASIDESPIFIPEPLTKSFIEKKIKSDRLIEIKVILQSLLDCNLENIEKCDLLNTKGVPIITRFDYTYSSGHGTKFRSFYELGRHPGIWNFLSDEDATKIKFHLPHDHVHIKNETGTCQKFSIEIPMLPSTSNDDDFDPLLRCLNCAIM